MTDAKGQGKSVEELFPCPFFTGAETGQCKSNGSLYAARHLWEEAAKRLKGQIKGQTEKRSPKPYGFRLLSGSGRRIRTLTNRVRVCRATFTQSGNSNMNNYSGSAAKVKTYRKKTAFIFFFWRKVPLIARAARRTIHIANAKPMKERNKPCLTRKPRKH